MSFSVEAEYWVGCNEKPEVPSWCVFIFSYSLLVEIICLSPTSVVEEELEDLDHLSIFTEQFFHPFTFR